jgi:pSer/pThr/pTyr-binding forkhead associated (FHA) protein
MRVVLEVVSGINRGKQIKVRAGEKVRVGRARPAEVAIADNFMSGLHFALECDADGCRLRDLNSRNGTKVNGELVIEAPLKDGDKIFAGRTNFSVRLERAKRSMSKSLSQSRSKSGSGRKTSRKLSTSRSSRRLSGAKPGVAAAPSPAIKPVSPKAAVEEAPPKPAVQAAPPKPAGEAVPVDPAVEAVPGKPADQPLPPVAKTPSPPPSATPAPVGFVSAHDLASYEAATLEGRLHYILSNQQQRLMALIDAVGDPGILELLQTHGDEHLSLYRSEQDQRVAPYLIRFASRSALLKQMIQRGWGRQWGLYLTSPLSLTDVRQYFRTALMITMPDGMELFSRFYDPRFFRGFLESCTAAEAEPFFGPVVSYFMEDERPEILLEFTRSQGGTEKKGHLLSALS